MSTPDHPQDNQPTVPYPPTAPAYGSAPADQSAYGSATSESPGYGAPPYFGAPYGAYAAPKTNTLAVVSLVSAIIGIVVLPFIGSIVAVITGHMGLSQIKQTGEQGRGMAIAGTIVGYVGLGFVLLLVVLFLSLLPLIIGSMTTYGTLS